MNPSLKIFFFFILAIVTSVALAQGEGNIWYFGNYAGLDFNTSPPTPLLDGQVNTTEGCASISDPSGNLLFYTDGIRVWDRTHTQMPNGFGLLGDPSSAQSGVIIPQPDNDSIYYLFTTPSYQNASIGFRYTIVNMNLNGGLGDVVTTSKNTLLFSPSSEKLAASFHCNNKDIWVVGRSNQDFYGYLITASGISGTPVITSGITSSSYPYYYGMKSSPNGKKIVANYANANVSELYDFDISTGQLSNPVILQHSSSDSGAEFSPDGTKLYVSLISTKEVYQYDLTASDINASGMSIGTTGGQHAGVPQLAPDGKIYIPENQSGAVAIIHSPNTLGTACNLQPSALNLGGRIATFGFPTMISNFFAEPVKVLTADTVCFSSLANFSLSGVMDEDSIRWNFGDPSTGSLNSDTGLTVSHTFSASGSFNIQAMVYYPCRTDTLYDTVYIAPLPTVAFSSLNACPSVPVIFQDSSAVSQGSITSWSWNFGDGSPLYSQQQVAGGHIYPDTGTYTVQLLVTSNAGCADSITQSVTIYPNPIANFGSSSYCKGASTLFSDSSTYTYGSINAWSWNFGDGSPLYNQQQVSGGHTYPDTGTYYVKLVVTSNTGCSDSVSKPIIIYPNPVANFSATDVCFGESIGFTDVSSVTIPNTITSWEWIFGDTSLNSSLQNPTQTYANYGSFDVKLIVSTNQSCKDSITKNIIVHPLPNATFFATNVCLGNSNSFTDESTIPAIVSNDVITTWQWDFNDSGATANPQNASHQYSSYGNYTVQLKVVSDFGCADSVSIPVVVNPLPVANFTLNDTAGCSPFCVSINDTSSIASGANVSWNWTLGDGATSTSFAPEHCYENNPILNGTPFAPLQFSIELTVVSDSGCTTTLIKNNAISVYPMSEAYFDVSPQITTLSNPVISCSNVSSTATLWSWNWGDGNSSSQTIPDPHVYADTGTYTVMLITNTQYGCADTSIANIVIEPDFTFYIPNAFSPNGDGVNDVFIPQGTFIGSFQMEIFDRWGNLIYKTDDITKPWIGAANHGKEVAQQDVYIYSIVVEDFKSKKYSYRGIVTLVK